MSALPSPAIRHLLDAPKNDWYVLVEDFLFVPGGYVSDGCSVPQWLWGVFPPLGAFFVPGLIHDFLYETKLYSRAYADWLFLQYLGAYSPTTPRANYIRYLSVRVFGGYAWKKAKYIDINNYKNEQN